MSRDDREFVAKLRYELNYLEQGGYERDCELHGAPSPFLGTHLCLNFGDPLRRHACHQSPLMRFVPEDGQNEEYPCHYIRLNASGDTAASLIEAQRPLQMVATLQLWLRATIARLEAMAERSEP